ncbi:putative transposase [Kitasatospora sp. GAS204A]|nr:putative transposase [Kitasatospora sp. GAS204B]
MAGQHIGGVPDRLSQQISATMPDTGEATTPQEFVRRLQTFKIWSGNPSLRELERRTGLPRSTLSGDLSHQRSRLPPLERVLALVTAFGASAEELARWQLSWQRIQLRQQSAQPPVPASRSAVEPPGNAQDSWIGAGRDAAGAPSRVIRDGLRAGLRCSTGRDGTPVLSVVTDDRSIRSGAPIDEIVREGARRLLAAALEAEVNQYIAELAAETDEHGRRPVVRNGQHRSRTVVTTAGPVEVTAPRVNDRRIDDRTGERKRFSSKILAPWCRKSPKISEVLPLLHLHGLSSGDFGPALEQFLGGTAGLSPATVTRLTKQWSDDLAGFQERDLSDRDFVYVWADGVHPKVRLGQAHSCVLVLLGVRLDGTKELIALAEGLRESTESWAELLHDCRRRGMRDPELVVGDGAMGLRKALAEVFPAARHQHCWVHEARNVTTCLPKSAQPGAAKAMQEIYHAADRAHAEKAIEAFARSYGAKWPEAVARITDDQEELLAFYDFPAEHWVHLRTTHPIESTFATVKLRTKVTGGAGGPAAALTMVFKLVESAQARWRAITGAHLVPLVRAGARFENGILVERTKAAA